MIVGFALMFSGFIAARFFKRKTWWFKLHRFFNITGACVVLAGVILMTLYLTITEGGHFNAIHSYIGFLIAVISIITPLIGFMQFKISNYTQKLKAVHRFTGRLLIILIFVNILSGLKISGII